MSVIDLDSLRRTVEIEKSNQLHNFVGSHDLLKTHLTVQNVQYTVDTTTTFVSDSLRFSHNLRLILRRALFSRRVLFLHQSLFACMRVLTVFLLDSFVAPNLSPRRRRS